MYIVVAYKYIYKYTHVHVYKLIKCHYAQKNCISTLTYMYSLIF